MREIEGTPVSDALNEIARYCHTANMQWWMDLVTGEPLKRNTGELLMLCVSELAEAMEGDRKDLMDNKLPNRKMLEVELADCLIRIFDFCGAHKLDIGGALVEKMEYNKRRKDHTKEGRMEPGGKRY